MWLTIPTQKAFWVPPLAVALLIALIFFLPLTWQESLSFVRSEIEQGAWWRVLSGQWIHLRFSHLITNLLGLGVIWLFFAEYLRARLFLPALTVTSVGCMWGTYLWAPEISHYVGFSGTLYGLFAWGACRDVLHRKSMGWLLLLIVVGKVSYDYWVGPVSLSGTAIDYLATPTHLFGVGSGIIWAILIFIGFERARSLDSSTPNS
ncbi:MAG: rhomboid family protease [Idiomarinaceae bacterium HL-53]|nr:MAG: rhomboid family protease [Idiomarinaceae bacterium HL-53]CUS48711.1 rhomboid family GlyGly-CTERM serine protease [Idiomarinaceae bacterium HL-53]